MKGKHPGELDLARLSDAQGREDLDEHLRWCSPCRRTLADYDWLQQELTAALDAEAAAAPVAAPDWDGVRKQLRESRPYPAERRFVVAAGVGLMALVMFVAPSALGSGVQAQTNPLAGVSEAPAPIVAVDTDAGAALTLTTTPVDGERQVSLPFVPPPTPPEPET